MPKKHHKTNFAKPVSTPHHSLASSSRSSQNDRFRSSASPSGDQPSVNDLISHLRQTQLSPSLSDNPRGIPRHVAPRSVHPSLRNLLELPETPPPRPRPGGQRTAIGARRLRRTPGPAAPESWLSGNLSADEDDSDLDGDETAKVIYRLERLSGMKFPAKRTLLHTLLKSMAMHWAWHVAYDGQFLSVLPTHVKLLLLSYIGYYAREQPRIPMRGLKPLFENSGTPGDEGEVRPVEDLDVTQLDLSGALGRWMSLKQLSTELFVSKKANTTQTRTVDFIPTSWDEEDDGHTDSGPSTPIPKPLQHLRFANLQYLSLAHPHPASVNWNSLISLLSRLSTITHLSLAHWPVPTVTPNALNASIRDPANRSLTFSYSGTDAYSAMENNWAESAGILRRLSRVTYCLKWLDLEGCSDWIPALNWDGTGPDGETLSTGPEWNRSWRDIEWVRLGPGWLPTLDEDAIPSTPAIASPIPNPNPRSLTASVHAPSSPSVVTADWDVEIERQKYRAAKQLEHFRKNMRAAKAVQRRVLQARKEGKGKWVQFSFGLEGVEDGVRDRLLGEELRRGFI